MRTPPPSPFDTTYLCICVRTPSRVLCSYCVCRAGFVQGLERGDSRGLAVVVRAWRDHRRLSSFSREALNPTELQCGDHTRGRKGRAGTGSPGNPFGVAQGREPARFKNSSLCGGRQRKLGAAMARYCLLLLLSLAWDATALVVTPAAARSTRAAPSRRREPLLQAADGAPDPEPAEPWCSEPGASASRAPRARRAHAAQFRVPPPHRAPPAQAARRAASWAGSLRSTRL